MIRQSEKEVKILIVDDDPDNLLLLEAILESEGFNNVIIADSADEAYKKLDIYHKNKAEGIALILMDIMMPKTTGIEATRRIKRHKHFLQVPIIMVSAKSEGSDLAEAFEAGAMDYVTKPINEIELMARITSALRLGKEMRARKKYERELKAVSDKLEEKNLQLEKMLTGIKQDLEAAGEMQKDLLPEDDLTINGINFKFFYEPCEHIGGDILGLTSLNSDTIAFYIIDVSGHGIKSAMTAVGIHHLLSSWAGERNILIAPDGCPRSPAYVASELNKEFSIKPSDNIQYFTMIYGIIDKKKKKLTYVRAGHPEPIIHKSNGDITILREGSRPIGLCDDAIYEHIEVSFNQGDRVIIYSDGITESKGSSKKEFFGEDRLVKIIKETRSMNISEVTKHISSNLSTWLQTSKPSDDIALMAIEFV